MEKIPLTSAGAELLRAELKRLKTVERRSIIEAIAEARAHGDLSENAEYHAAKEKQAFVETKIQELEYKLSVAQIIDPKDINTEGKIIFGATVTIENLDTEEEVTYQIVGVDEADIRQGKLSVLSPIARALIGKEEGDIVELETPSGKKELEILKVEYK
ncbi:MAG: transcription elongation factor GreA [Neisseriaceae bacterium]